MNKIYLTLIILIFSPLILMIFHIFFLRAINLIKIPLSNQLSLVLSIIALNIPILLMIYRINNSISSAIYSFIVYNSLAYSYFHFFNMSETARRIRILIELKLKKCISKQELVCFYKTDFMITTRLDRLISLKQIRKQDDKYVLSGKILLFGAILINSWKKVLGFK